MPRTLSLSFWHDTCIPFSVVASVLTIDDDGSVRSVLNRGLSTLGHRVLEADSGPSGLKMAFCRKIDIILLDISMPGMDGLTVLKKLKEKYRTSHIPVLILTGNDDEDMRTQAQYDYAEDYILKSTGIRAISDKIECILKSRPTPHDGWPTKFRW